MFKTFLGIAIVLLLSACSDTKKESQKSAASDMKCGAGKCGANMFDGKGTLAKRKNNILSQMREDDPRKECVKLAKSTKEAYDCVRSPQSGKLTLKCGIPEKKEPAMKCSAGKCGSK